jgi:hypothetical protein
LIQGAFHAAFSDALSHVGVDFRRGDLGVPQQFLDGPEVFSFLEEMGRKTMPQYVAGESLVDSGLVRGPPQGAAVYLRM